MNENPIDGIWYSTSEEPLPGSPCYGCRRALRRSHVIDEDGTILQFHLVRQGATLDCIGLNYRMQVLLSELDESAPVR